MKILPFIFLLIFLSITGNTQEKNKKWLQLFSDSRNSESKDSGYYLIKLKVPGSIETLTGKGVQVLRQLSQKEFIIRSGYPSSIVLDYALPANAIWKLSPQLLDDYLEISSPSRQLRKFSIYSNQVLPLQRELEQLKDPFIRIEYFLPTLLVISTTFEKLVSDILPLSSVYFAESGDRVPKEEMALNSLDLATNKVNLLHSEFSSLDGGGMTVSIKEQKPDTLDIDLKGRYISTNYQATNVSGHATAMTTIIAGAGNSYYTGQGVAPASSFTSASFTSLMPEPDAEYRKYNISVQNHSYGTGIENYYGADAAAYDQLTVRNPYLIHIFSAGNAGSTTSSTGLYSGITGYANLTGSFKMSKNSISVGSVDSLLLISPLSSKGPAYDGRVKPELVASGEDGSSGAAAIVSGISILCQQTFKGLHNGLLPDAALVKAILINSADDIARKGVDYGSGFGNINAYRAVKIINDEHFFSGTIPVNGSQHFTLNIPAGSKNLKISLVWTDPAANANAFTALVNDIDMELINHTTNEKWKPWVLNNFAHPDSLALLPVRARDSLNNVEQITLAEAGGEYEIVITGYKMNSFQPFYIAYQWDAVDYFKWTYPSAKDNMLPSGHSLLRWETAITGNGKIQYSGDGGKSWKALFDSVDLSLKQFRIPVPDSFHVGVVRMVAGINSFSSKSFTVSAPLHLQVGFNCADSLQWTWNPVKNKQYLFYRLGERYLEPAGNYTDTSAIIKKSAGSSFYYAVAPILDFNHTGVNSYTINYTNQGIGCYLIALLAEKEEDRTLVQFSLGSLYNIQSIALEKLVAQSFQTITHFSVSTGNNFKMYDSLLTSGINSYRVKITFNDGRVLYSATESVYHFTTTEYILYPNPVASNQKLNVLVKNMEGVIIRCYSMEGRKLLERKLNNFPLKLHLPFSRGLYFVELMQEGKRVHLGKLIVN